MASYPVLAPVPEQRRAVTSGNSSAAGQVTADYRDYGVPEQTRGCSSPAAHRRGGSEPGVNGSDSAAPGTNRASVGDDTGTRPNRSESLCGPQETWKRIPSARGYWASTKGRIQSVDRWVRDRRGRERHQRGALLKPAMAGNGYLTVDLPGGSRYVHALVLEAFAGPPEPGQECLHGPAGPLCNTWPDNLRYGSHAENEADKRLWGKRVSASEARPAVPIQGELFSIDGVSANGC